MGNVFVFLSFNYSTFILHTDTHLYVMVFFFPFFFFLEEKLKQNTVITLVRQFYDHSILRCISLDLIYYYCYIPLSGNTRLQRHSHLCSYLLLFVSFLLFSVSGLHGFVIRIAAGVLFYFTMLLLQLSTARWNSIPPARGVFLSILLFSRGMEVQSFAERSHVRTFFVFPPRSFYLVLCLSRFSSRWFDRLFEHIIDFRLQHYHFSRAKVTL